MTCDPVTKKCTEVVGWLGDPPKFYPPGHPEAQPGPKLTPEEQAANEKEAELDFIRNQYLANMSDQEKDQLRAELEGFAIPKTLPPPPPKPEPGVKLVQTRLPYREWGPGKGIEFVSTDKAKNDREQ